jgi:hypothetical protein
LLELSDGLNFAAANDKTPTQSDVFSFTTVAACKVVWILPMPNFSSAAFPNGSSQSLTTSPLSSRAMRTGASRIDYKKEAWLMNIEHLKSGNWWHASHDPLHLVWVGFYLQNWDLRMC